ncbi:MAG: hypothetical protein K0S12_1957 [Bacteroidetes bacterium]|jgi:hypothetical protein|nr:hypothetical protein [Bacteroidota bacterium]
MNKTEYLNEEYIRIYTSDDRSFLTIELKGNLSLDEYKTILNRSDTLKAIEASKRDKLFLELHGLMSLNMEQQDWTSKEYTKAISGVGVSWLAIGVDKHVYPAFKPFWSLYEKTAPIQTKYFCSLTDVNDWLS